MSKEFKVVKILDKYNVVINAGENDIKKGDIFEIYLEEVVIVTDPDTNEELGSYDFVKATIVATDVDKRMTKCTNAKTSGGLANSFKITALISTTDELNVDYDAMTDDFETVDRVIRIGDLVRKIKCVEDTQNPVPGGGGNPNI